MYCRLEIGKRVFGLWINVNLCTPLYSKLEALTLLVVKVPKLRGYIHLSIPYTTSIQSRKSNVIFWLCPSWRTSVDYSRLLQDYSKLRIARRIVTSTHSHVGRLSKDSTRIDFGTRRCPFASLTNVWALQRCNLQTCCQALAKPSQEGSGRIYSVDSVALGVPLSLVWGRQTCRVLGPVAST